MLDRKLRRRVERAFYEYEANVARGAEAIVEIAENGITTKYGAVGGGGEVANPTESKVIRLAEGHDCMQWCRVVEKTLDHFRGTGKDTLIKLRYFGKLSERRVCDKLYVEKSSYYTWIDTILVYATMIAIQYGLLQIP